ncbi:MAG: FHIPEP family type III secretion protein, partial [Planctomycetota bacterium]
QNVHQLTQLARERLARTICQRFSDQGGLRVVTLSPQLEDRIAQKIEVGEHEVASTIPPQEVDTLCKQILALSSTTGEKPVLLSRPATRAALRWLTKNRIPNLIALSHAEITLDTRVISLGTVGAKSAAA